MMYRGRSFLCGDTHPREVACFATAVSAAWPAKDKLKCGGCAYRLVQCSTRTIATLDVRQDFGA